jgi:hypothetical protein
MEKNKQHWAELSPRPHALARPSGRSSPASLVMRCGVDAILGPSSWGGHARDDVVAHLPRAHRQPQLKMVFTTATSAVRGWHRARRGPQELTGDGRQGWGAEDGWHVLRCGAAEGSHGGWWPQAAGGGNGEAHVHVEAKGWGPERSSSRGRAAAL